VNIVVCVIRPTSCGRGAAGGTAAPQNGHASSRT
jgi:hypothetical protein